MRTENHIEFTEDLSERLGFFVWMHSAKGKRIRIGLLAATALCLILAVTGLLRRLVIHTSIKYFLIFLFLAFVCLGVMIIVFPLIYRKKVLKSIDIGTVQIVTMDDHYVNLHVGSVNAQFRWNKFIDIDEDDDYYYLFSEENYVVLDKLAFPGDGHDIFLSYHTPERLLRDASRKSRLERYYMPLSKKDHLTPVIHFFKDAASGKKSRR